MGLPSGNRWAVSNLDANGPYYFQESPFQYECSFFSWGNVTPHNLVSGTAFDYNFGGMNSSAPWYEGQPYGDTPGSKLTGNIPLTHDAARKILGSPWRMPSADDFYELIDNAICIDVNGEEIEPSKADKRITINGVRGIYLQSKINGARLFIPCSGFGSGQSLQSRTTSGFYWSSTWASSQYARFLRINSAAVNPRVADTRHYGFAIRPIWTPRDRHE